MTPDQIAQALTSGMAGPALGAALVLLSWLLQKYRNGVPLREQLAHVGRQLRPVAIPALTAGGVLLAAGAGYKLAGCVAIGALLSAAGMTAAPPPAPEPQKPAVPMLASLLVGLFALGLALWPACLPAASVERTPTCAARYEACAALSKSRAEYDACRAKADAVCLDGAGGAGGAGGGPTKPARVLRKISPRETFNGRGVSL